MANNQDQQDYQDYQDYQKYQTGQQPSSPGPVEQFARNAVNQLPAIGGIAGGIAGTPMDAVSGPMGTVVGAGMGGYLGEASKNAINNYMGWGGADAPQTAGQALLQPVRSGLIQGSLQGAGQIAAPLIGKALGGLSDKGSEALEDLADEKTYEATGATGKELQGFKPGSAQELRDQGIVSFGNSQQKIAEKAAAALEKSGKQTGDVLANLDAQGATVDQADIINSIRQRSAELGKDPAQFGVADSLNRLADRMQTMIETNGGNSEIPLSTAETTKKGFQYASNYANQSPMDITVSKEAGNIYRKAVEDAATKFDPSASQTFQEAKQTWGLLKPIAKATARRASMLNQSPTGGIGDQVATGVGSLVGGVPGAMVAAPLRRMVVSRIAPSLATVYGAGANALGALPTAGQAVTPAAMQALPALQYGLMAPPPSQPQQPPNFSTIPGRNGH